MAVHHAIPTEDKRLAFEVVAEAGRIDRALAGDTVTVAAIDQGLAAASRLRRLSASMETALRRQRAAALQAQREAIRERDRAEQRNAVIRRERGLPPPDADLAMPGWS